MRISWGASLTVPGADRFYDEMRAGRAFAQAYNNPATAANYNHIQLFNPAASGVVVIVKSIVYSSEGAQRFRFNIHNDALTNPVGTARNLLVNAAVGKAEVRWQDNATRFGSEIHDCHLLASTPFVISNSWIIELGESEGILAVPQVQNIGMSCSFTWIEL